MQALGYKHFFLSLFLGVVREAEKELPLLQLFFCCNAECLERHSSSAFYSPIHNSIFPPHLRFLFLKLFSHKEREAKFSQGITQ